jgi:hypothetical protein
MRTITSARDRVGRAATCATRFGGAKESLSLLARRLIAID